MRVELVSSSIDAFPPKDRPEVVFVGRSNVGKSSLINLITGRNVAKVSKQPGRTRTVNFFLLENKLYLVDVPGYGFAKRSKEERNRWKVMMENYFTERKDNIKKVFQLIDALVGPQASDVQMMEWLSFMELPFTLVLTKADKATQREISRTIKEVKDRFPHVKRIISSAKEGKGKKEILAEMFS